MVKIRVELRVSTVHGWGLGWFKVQTPTPPPIRIGVVFFRVWFWVRVGVRQRCSLVFCGGYTLIAPIPCCLL